MKKNIFNLLIVVQIIFASALETLSQRPFIDNPNDFEYTRGIYLIVLGNQNLYSSLIGEANTGNFVEFKRSQGFDVDVVTVSASLTAQEVKDTIIMPYYEVSNGMLEYVLLVGDVNGSFTIPTFTIPSYN